MVIVIYITTKKRILHTGIQYVKVCAINARSKRLYGMVFSSRVMGWLWSGGCG